MVPEDQIRVILSILISVPLGFSIRYLPKSYNKYFSLIAALVIQIYVYREEIYLSVLFHIFIYVFIYFKGRNCGFIVTVVSLLLLSGYHIYRMAVDYGSWTLDVSTILMGNVCKYSLFAYSYQDGGQDVDKLKTVDQKSERIAILPSFVDFIGYCLFLPTCVVSTPITYYKYDEYINKRLCFSHVPFLDSLKAILHDFTVAIGCACVYFFGVVYFPLSLISTPTFTDNSFLYVLGYSQLSIYLYHWKYFFAFKLCMLPIHSSGISYNPQLSSPFDGIKTVDVYNFNTTLSLPTKINSWNIPVQQWLRKCIYERLTVSRERAKILTFLISAFWHGFYGGYYFAFFLFFVHMYLATTIFKIKRNQEQHPLIKMYQKYSPFSQYGVLVLLTLSFSHSGIYFAVLSITHCLEYLRSIYFLPFVLLGILCLVAQLELRKGGKKEKEKEKGK